MLCKHAKNMASHPYGDMRLFQVHGSKPGEYPENGVYSFNLNEHLGAGFSYWFGSYEKLYIKTESGTERILGKSETVGDLNLTEMLTFIYAEGHRPVFACKKTRRGTEY